MIEPIRIEIITGKQSTLCKKDCGTDWSRTEIQIQVRKDIRKRFGNQVRVDFKLSDEIDEQTEKENNDPVLLINGQNRLAGQFDIRQVMDILEIQMEIGAPKP